MSADNWSICPQCYENETAELSALQEKLAAVYGVVPLEEYLAIDAEYKTRKKKNLTETLREDYEIYLNKGVVEVSYHCSCENCGLSHSFSYSEKIPVLISK